MAKKSKLPVENTEVIIENKKDNEVIDNKESELKDDYDDKTNEYDDDIPPPPPIIEEVKTKPKRVLTEAQKEALAKGREIGLKKLKESKQSNLQKKEVEQQIKKVKEETNIKKLEDLKHIADVGGVYSKVEKLNSKFENVENILNQLIELKKKKLDDKLQQQINNEIRSQAKQTLLKNNMKPYIRWER
jgi:ribosome-associated toxin RatA of RatAB toxin-antitoxin module